MSETAIRVPPPGYPRRADSRPRPRAVPLQGRRKAIDLDLSPAWGPVVAAGVPNGAADDAQGEDRAHEDRSARSFSAADDSWLVVGSWPVHHATRGGSTTWRSIRTKWLEVGREKLKVQAKTFEGPDRAEALTRIGTIAPPHVNYQQKTDREIQIVRLMRGR